MVHISQSEPLAGSSDTWEIWYHLTFRCLLCWISYMKLLYRPKSKKELFDLYPASTQNVIECIFGVLTWCFQILVYLPHYNMDVQACMHTTCPLCYPQFHFDFDDLAKYVNNQWPGLVIKELAHTPPNNQLWERANVQRDQIAKAMWDNYQVYIHSGGNPMETQ